MVGEIGHVLVGAENFPGLPRFAAVGGENRLRVGAGPKDGAVGVGRRKRDFGAAVILAGNRVGDFFQLLPPSSERRTLLELLRPNLATISTSGLASL